MTWINGQWWFPVIYVGIMYVVAWWLYRQAKGLEEE